MWTFEVQRQGAVTWPARQPDQQWYPTGREFDTEAEAYSAARTREITSRHPVATRVREC